MDEQADTEKRVPCSLREAHALAFSMYQQQHTRWNHWTLFFFGALISLFALWGQTKACVPLWIVSLLAAFISVLWVRAALSIRAHTWAWRETIKEFENSEVSQNLPYHTFEKHIKKFSRWKDFLTTLNPCGKEPRGSLTRSLILLGVLAALCFLILAYQTCPYEITVIRRAC